MIVLDEVSCCGWGMIAVNRWGHGKKDGRKLEDDWVSQETSALGVSVFPSHLRCKRPTIVTGNSENGTSRENAWQLWQLKGRLTAYHFSVSAMLLVTAGVKMCLSQDISQHSHHYHTKTPPVDHAAYLPCIESINSFLMFHYYYPAV